MTLERLVYVNLVLIATDIAAFFVTGDSRSWLVPALVGTLAVLLITFTAVRALCIAVAQLTRVFDERGEA